MSAVSGHQCGHALVDLGGRLGSALQRVVGVRVQVDEPGCHHLPGGVDASGSGQGVAAQFPDPAPGDADVEPPHRGTGTVDDVPAIYHDVEFGHAAL